MHCPKCMVRAMVSHGKLNIDIEGMQEAIDDDGEHRMY